MDKLPVKYYEVFITGDVWRNEDGTVKKGTDGKPEPKWSRDSNPSAELRQLGFVPGRFFQTEMVEVNLGADVITSASKKTYDIGPLALRGQTVNIFESRQREIYKAITARILAGKIEVVVPATERTGNGIVGPAGQKYWTVTGKLTDYAQPGNMVEFATGFKYYVFQRSRTTHKLEAIKPNTYDKNGVLKPTPVIRSVGRLFLFANELDAADAHIKTAIEACEEFKVPVDTTGNERKDDVVEGKGGSEDTPTV